MQSSFGKNLLASLVIFLVAIPLNLGIALASGVSPAVGLFSGIVSGVVVGLLAGCPLQVSGPAAGLIAVVWQIVDAHGLAMLGPVVLAAGLLQIALGASRLAPWFRAVCPTVIQGMLAGIGVLIFASQFQVMLDQKPKVSGLTNLLALPGAVWEVVAHGAGHPSALLGILTISTIVAWTFAPRRFHVVPGSLMGVAAAVIAAAIIKPRVPYVELPGNPFEGISLVAMSQVQGLLYLSVLGSVIALAFIATAQTLLTATAIDRMHDGERTDYNREIIAQGVGNSICGAFGLLPVSGVIVRSAANVEAGATGRTSAVLHGIWVGLFLLLLSPLLGFVPLPALAAVLVYTGYRLVNVKAIKEIIKFGRGGLVVYTVTLVTVVSVDLLTGILVGFLLSAARLVVPLTRCNIVTQELDGALVVAMGGSATFLTLPRLADHLAALPSGREVHLFLSDLNHIDHACLEHLMGWEELYIQQGGQVYIEWDHLIQRFHQPLTSEMGERVKEPISGVLNFQDLDLLSSRARVLELSEENSWNDLAEKITGTLVGLESGHRSLVEEGLAGQFREQNFPSVAGVGLPHLMIPGLPRHELVVIRMARPLATLDPTEKSLSSLVVLVGPYDFSEQASILAGLSRRASEGLAEDLTKAVSTLEVRRTLLRHSHHLTLALEPSSLAATELADKSLWELGSSLPQGCLITQVCRDGRTIVPMGNTKLLRGDRVLVLGSEEAIEDLFERYLATAPELVA